MTLTQIDNLSMELQIIDDFLLMFDENSFKPSTYNDLIARRKEILGVE